MRLRQTRLMFAAMCGLVVQACASAPFDLAAAPPAPPAMASQQELRTAAATLVATVEEEGWQLAEARGSNAFSLLGRLVGGAGEEATDGGEDPVSQYLHEGAAGDVDARLRADIRLAGALAREVSEAAGAVAASAGALERAALDRDIAEAEAALTAARKARAFFAAVQARIEAREALTAQPATADALRQLEVRIEALAASADALADRRWARMTGAVS